MRDYRTGLEKKIEYFLNNGDIPHPNKSKEVQEDIEKAKLDSNVDAYLSLKSKGKSSEVIETDTYKSLQSAAITPSGSLLDTESGIEMICNHSLRLLAQSTPFKLWTLQAKKFLDLSETALLAVYESYRK
ncbi:hypothetical protein [Photobacterium halotolerans]|uniref:Uncharacterized protein n=1 Tax=Photobacterium halotolerans TaxID=265726 RepID=A0A0F5VA41_9GAMM|nr:hypothetical protein [Photobacterium halotolerans]KKC98616.1 hypothetical protein KY46_17850 [Photobacterium halotolerans]